MTERLTFGSDERAALMREVASDETVAMLERDLCPCLPCIDKAQLINRVRQDAKTIADLRAQLLRRSPLAFAGNVDHGLWWVRVFGAGLTLRAPWCRPLFSERNGLRRSVSIAGWRIGFLERNCDSR